jgi:eukaryotic-like serine/threonine-protein kinase
MPLSPGDKLGPYEIRAAIGKGGMGEVYRAHDPRLQRDVAIKVSAERFNERFEREARAVAALNHPNICQVYDVGPNYLVMELIEGPTLGDIIKTGPVLIDEALRIADQIGEALAAAHEKRITHRDLKPGNVKVKDDGVVKVLDFGLAKIGGIPEATSVGEDSPTMSMTLTQHGMILGTASYMAPEQAKGKAVDARADIWAFGVVLYEMLTAQRLFKGEDLGDILASVVKEVPDLSVIPVKARRLVQACLEKDPKNRLQAIGDRKLLLTEPQVVQVSSSAVRRQWLWPTIAGVVTLAAVVLGWTHFREQPPALQTLRYQLARPEGAEFRYLQMSPDGRYIAYAQTARNTNTRLHVWALDALEERDFPGTEGTTYPFFSPDSSHIGFFAQGKLKQIAVSGGPATNIADAPDPRGGTWGADGTIVFTPTVNGGLSRVASAGGTPVPLKLQILEAGTSLRYPMFLDDSDRFLYFVQSDKAEVAGVFAGSLGGMAPVRLMENVGRVQFVALPASKALGHLLYRRDATLMAQPFDANTMKTTGDAFPMADQIPDAGNIGYGAFAAARNGTLVFVSGGREAQERELVWLDRGGKPGKSVVKQRGLSSFALASNGVQVLFEQRSITGADLWLHDIVHGATQRFTFDVNPAQSPVWSPDDARVAFGQGSIAGPLYQKATQTSAKEEALGPKGTNITPTQLVSRR